MMWLQHISPSLSGKVKDVCSLSPLLPVPLQLVFKYRQLQPYLHHCPLSITYHDIMEYFNKRSHLLLGNGSINPFTTMDTDATID
jgi:hypothetical protein